MAGRSFGPEPQIKQTVGKFLDKIQTFKVFKNNIFQNLRNNSNPSLQYTKFYTKFQRTLWQPPSPLPYFVKAAVIWQRYLQTSNSNNLIFAFFVFSLPLPPLLPTPLYVSMQP